MSQYIKYVFPPANTQDICLTQSTTGAMNLVLNGNLTPNNDSNSVSFISYGYSRQISITSGSDYAGVMFTIVGTQNGVPIVETLAGPNMNSVYSVNVYDVITSISVNAVVTGVQVGTGYLGFFNLINIDLNSFAPPNFSPLCPPNVNPPYYPHHNYNHPSINYTLSLGSLSSTNQIETTVYTILDTISEIGSTFQNIVATNVGTLYKVEGPTAANLYILPTSPATSMPIVNSILIVLTGTTSTLGNGITMIFMQQ